MGYDESSELMAMIRDASEWKVPSRRESEHILDQKSSRKMLTLFW